MVLLGDARKGKAVQSVAPHGLTKKAVNKYHFGNRCPGPSVFCYDFINFSTEGLNVFGIGSKGVQGMRE